MINGTGLVIILLATLAFYIGDSAVHGIKIVGHKTKCGIERVVGKHCDK